MVVEGTGSGKWNCCRERLRDLAVEGVGGDGADEFVEVSGRGDASELRVGERETSLQIEMIRFRG